MTFDEDRFKARLAWFEAQQAKWDGMERAERHADPFWWRTMLILGVEVAKRKRWFIAPDIERLRRQRHPNVTTHEPRAMGPLVMEMKRLGICEPTDEFWPSGGKSDHNTPVRVWESLLYTGPRPHVQRFRRVADPRQGDLFT